MTTCTTLSLKICMRMKTMKMSLKVLRLILRRQSMRRLTEMKLRENRSILVLTNEKNLEEYSTNFLLCLMGSLGITLEGRFIWIFERMQLRCIRNLMRCRKLMKMFFERNCSICATLEFWGLVDQQSGQLPLSSSQRKMVEYNGLVIFVNWIGCWDDVFILSRWSRMLFSGEQAISILWKLI